MRSLAAKSLLIVIGRLQLCLGQLVTTTTTTSTTTTALSTATGDPQPTTTRTVLSTTNEDPPSKVKVSHFFDYPLNPLNMYIFLFPVAGTRLHLSSWKLPPHPHQRMGDQGNLKYERIALLPFNMQLPFCQVLGGWSWELHHFLFSSQPRRW